MSAFDVAAQLGDTQTFAALVQYGNPAPMRVPGPDGRSPLQNLYASMSSTMGPRYGRVMSQQARAYTKPRTSPGDPMIRLSHRAAVSSEVDGCAVRAALLDGDTAGALCPASACAQLAYVPLLRSTLWKLLLGYMPWSYANCKWEKCASRRRRAYRLLIQEHFMRPTVGLAGRTRFAPCI